MKLLFLDMDGVVNTIADKYCVSLDLRMEILQGKDYHRCQFDPRLVFNFIRLLEFCKENNIYIVISSTWRMGTEVEDWNKFFNKHFGRTSGYKLDNLVVALTPVDGRDRGLQIQTELEVVDLTQNTDKDLDLVDKTNHKYDILEISKMITSDDVFKKMIDRRLKEDQKRFKSEMLIKEKTVAKGVVPKSIDLKDERSVEQFNDFYTMRKSSYTQYLKKTIGRIEPSFSNGETGLMYLIEQIADPGLYLLDEPENSMSCETQLKLVEFIELSARAFNTQFIIATHSPFLLSIPNAKIYNLDTRPVSLSKWWELENMKRYFQIFNKYQTEFQQSL